MSTGRNEPCPCGSGRKHKNCCLGRTGATDAVADARTGNGGVRLSAEMRALVARESAWQAEVVPLQIGFEGDAAARPVGVLVTAGGFVLGGDVRRRVAGDARSLAMVLDRALAAAAREVGRWPATVEVRHPEVAAALTPLLRPRDASAVTTPHLPDLEEAARALMDQIAGNAWWPPICRTEVWAGWELPRQRVADLFAAAAAFWREQPWRWVANLQAPHFTAPSGREWTVTVLGNGGEEFGIALYSNAGDLFDRALRADPENPFASMKGRMLSVTFDRERDLPPSARRELRSMRWEVADRDAVPTLMTVNTPGGGATSADLADLLVAFRSVPPFAEAHRLELMREDRTGTPCRPIEWHDPSTGARLRYAGEGVAAEQVADEVEVAAHTDPAAIMRQAIEQMIEREGQGALEAVLQQKAEEIAGTWNDAPQPELGGLSPNRVRDLIAQANWLAPDTPVRLRRDLTLDELAASDMLFNVRVLLAHARETKGLAVTTSGNLKLAVVDTLLDRVRLPESFENFRAMSKRITEQDVRALHEPRVLAELGGLLRLLRSRFELTDEGERLLDDPAAGDLFAHLFATCFGEFNLAYSSFGDWPELQRQAAYTLYRLGDVASDWRSAEELLSQVVLPYALERAPTSRQFDLPATLLRQHVLDRLVGFALLERRESIIRADQQEPARYRLAPLFKKFIAFVM